MSRARDVASNNLALINPTSDGNLLTASSGAWVSQAPAPAPPDVAGNIVELTANGSIADGKPVILENAGTVAQVAQTGSTAAAVLQGASGKWMSDGASTFGWSQMFYNTVDDTIVVVYRDEQNSNYPTVCIGTVSNNTASGVSWGTPATLSTSGGGYWIAGAADGNGRMAAFWQNQSTGNNGKCRGFVKSGSSVSLGNISTYSNAGVQYNHATYDSHVGAIVLGYRQYTNGNTAYLRYFQVTSSNNINAITGEAQIHNSYSTEYNRIAYSPDHQRVMMVYTNTADNSLRYSLMSYSGGALYNARNGAVDSNSNQGCCVVYDESIDKFIAFYGSNTNTRGEGRIITVTAGGSGSSPSDTVSVGAAQNFNSYATGQVEVAYWASQNMSVIAYTGTPNSEGRAQTVSVSGSTITYGGELNTSPSPLNSAVWHMPVYDPDNDSVVIGFRAYNSSTSLNQSTTSIIAMVATTNLTATNFLGIASGSVTNGQTATIQLTGNVDDAQTGMTVNDTMYVQDDGTISTATGQNVVAGRALSATQLKIA